MQEAQQHASDHVQACSSLKFCRNRFCMNVDRFRLKADTSDGLVADAPSPLVSTGSLFQIVISRGVNEEANEDLTL